LKNRNYKSINKKMVTTPSRINLANLPTKIEKLDRFSKELGGPDIYIKRDDQTGMELSGNKVRKLEFSVKEALGKGCDTLITCGGEQSNHCRATAAVAARLGMKSYLVLRGLSNTPIDGNLFIDKLLGANLIFISSEEYRDCRMAIMAKLKSELEKEGLKPYIIPEGASNGIGAYGYYKAMEEIIRQEEEMNIHFDSIVIAVGSGGTYAGLMLGKKIFGNKTNIVGINVCDDKEYFENKILEIFAESTVYLAEEIRLKREEIQIIDGYVGEGYGLSSKEQLKFIADLAMQEGLILDNVYTGKAMYGLSQEIKKGKFKGVKNILFIHTGGIFELFSRKHLFEF
jgi:D-cysteine desulfhydrase